MLNRAILVNELKKLNFTPARIKSIMVAVGKALVDTKPSPDDSMHTIGVDVNKAYGVPSNIRQDSKFLPDARNNKNTYFRE